MTQAQAFKNHSAIARKHMAEEGRFWCCRKEARYENNLPEWFTSANENGR